MLVLCHSKWKISKGSCSPNSFNILLILYSDGFITKSSAKKQINLKKEATSIYLLTDLAKSFIPCGDLDSFGKVSLSIKPLWQSETHSQALNLEKIVQNLPSIFPPRSWSPLLEHPPDMAH